MKEETFLKLLKEAAHEFSGKKKQPTTPAKQFERGALWLWQLLMSERDVTYYEAMLRNDVEARLDKVEPWQESLITETAKMMVRHDRLEAEIAKTGDLIDKYDKNMNIYKESNPLHVHLKELDRTIGMQREHLGLSFKVNPSRMKDSPKPNDNEQDKLRRILDALND